MLASKSGRYLLEVACHCDGSRLLEVEQRLSEFARFGFLIWT